MLVWCSRYRLDDDISRKAGLSNGFMTLKANRMPKHSIAVHNSMRQNSGKVWWQQPHSCRSMSTPTGSHKQHEDKDTVGTVSLCHHWCQVLSDWEEWIHCHVTVCHVGEGPSDNIHLGKYVPWSTFYPLGCFIKSIAGEGRVLAGCFVSELASTFCLLTAWKGIVWISRSWCSWIWTIFIPF